MLQINNASLIYSFFQQRDEDFDVRLLIHQSLAGCVIGKGGQKIKEIRDVSNLMQYPWLDYIELGF